MNSRYRRGWFGESHRHYLASKGISLKYYSPMIKGKNMQLQRHRGAGVLRDVEEVDVRDSFIRDFSQKPSGGLWTSTVNDKGKTEWENFLSKFEGKDYLEEGEEYGIFGEIIPKRSMDLKVNEDANIFEIVDDDDVKFLMDNYGNEDNKINWSDVAKDFDGVHMTQSGRNAIWREFGTDLWDAESSAFFNKDAVEVIDSVNNPPISFDRKRNLLNKKIATARKRLEQTEKNWKNFGTRERAESFINDEKKIVVRLEDELSDLEQKKREEEEYEQEI